MTNLYSQLYAPDYTGDMFLPGISTDIIKMRRVFRGLGSKNPRVLTTASSEEIYQSICGLAAISWFRHESILYIYFTGHGTQRPDQSGDEVDGLDEGFVSSNGIIFDDRLLQALSYFHASAKLVVIIDACHSGTLFDLEQGSVKADVVVLSACRDAETTMDTASGGFFTNIIAPMITTDTTLQDLRDLQVRLPAGQNLSLQSSRFHSPDHRVFSRELAFNIQTLNAP